MKAHSIDLRMRIVGAVDSQMGTHQEIAEMFQVSKAFLEKLLKQRRETGSIEPLPHGGGQTPSFNKKQIELIKNKVLKDNDITLEELREYAEKRFQKKSSIPTICRVLQKLDLRRKKKL
jgi:transposase